MHPFAYLLLITAAVVTVADCFCPQQNKTGDLKFTKELGNLDFVRRTQGIAIICCAQGYDNISWYRKESNMWHRFPPPAHGDPNAPALDEDGQLLRINSAKPTDQTSYRCDVTGKGKLIQHITELIVIECDPFARGPILTEPVPENQTIYKYGVNVTFHCTGFFGCGDPGQIQLVLWLVNGISAKKVSPRYIVETSYKNNRTIKQATLTITYVQEQDINRKLSCILATPQPPQTKTDVYIFKKDKSDVPTIPWMSIGLIIGGCILFIIVGTLVAILLHCLYGPQIRRSLSSIIRSLGPKYIDNENYIYNVFIYNAEEDMSTALYIKKKLSDKQYKVYATDDIEGNQSLINTFSEKTAQSALGLFLYSEALLNDNRAKLLLQSYICERRGKDIMFLEMTDYKSNEMVDCAQHVEDRDELRENNIRQEEEAIDNGNENNNVSMATEAGTDVPYLQFLKGLSTLKVPPPNANRRKKNYFWCSLQNKIPKFTDKRKLSARDGNSKGKNLPYQRCVSESNRESEHLIPVTQSIDDGQSSPSEEEVGSNVSNENEQTFLQTSNTETDKSSESCMKETVVEVNTSSNDRQDDFIQ